MIKKIYTHKLARYSALVILPIWLVWGVLGVVGQATPSLAGAALSLTPAQGTYEEGNEFAVEMLLSSSDPINAVGATLLYDRAMLEVLDVHTKNSIVSLWVLEPRNDEDIGAITFSGGITTRSGFSGTGNIVSVLFRARAPGETRVKIIGASVLAHDGRGTDILQRISSGIFLLTKMGTGDNRFDLDGNGYLEMKDVGVFVSHWDEPYAAKYDFNKNGKVDFSDFISLIYKINRTR